MALRAASRSGLGYPWWASDPPCGRQWPRVRHRAAACSSCWAVGGAFTGVLVPLRLALGIVENRSNRLLARGMAGGDVEEPLGGSQSLTS